ncbi:MAG: ribonuclease HII, partial [Pseudothermotoga sp.]
MRDELFEFDSFYKRTFKNVIGVDEAGRGCIAGPVVAAAVIL